VDADAWSPQHVSEALRSGSLTAGRLDVVLVGGTHPATDALAAAGATWCVPEVELGAMARDAIALATTPPSR
jgi:hypothetical protein